MKDAGINTSVFKPHSTRSAATSAAKAANVPIHEIMNTAGWRSDSTFAKFYDRPITNDSNFAEAILATVPPETIDPFTEVLPRPIRRSIPRSRLGNDAAC